MLDNGLTRYLYVKDRVEYSLFVAILKKCREESKFWAYELYFSGYAMETVRFLWDIYFRIYSAKYPNLELFLRTKTEEWMNDKSKYWIIGTIVENLARQEIQMDEEEFVNIKMNQMSLPVLELQTFSKLLSKPENEILHKITVATTSEELLGFLQNINTHGNSQFQTLLEQTCGTIKIISSPVKYLQNLKYACISRTYTYSYYFDYTPQKKQKNKKMDTKKFSILVESDVLKYTSKPFIENHAWKILSKLCLFPIRNAPNLYKYKITDYQNWLFYACVSPIWEKRIHKYGGKINKHKKNVEFSNQDKEDQFHNWYNLEPDEQSIQIQHMWFGVE